MHPSTSRRSLVAIAILVVAPATALSQTAQTPPATPRRVVVDEYFGNKIEDPYRYMEDLKSTEVQNWFKAQNDYTRSVLARIPGRDALFNRIKQLDEERPRGSPTSGACRGTGSSIRSGAPPKTCRSCTCAMA